VAEEKGGMWGGKADRLDGLGKPECFRGEILTRRGKNERSVMRSNLRETERQTWEEKMRTKREGVNGVGMILLRHAGRAVLSEKKEDRHRHA